jgi:hypothetical protein
MAWMLKFVLLVILQRVVVVFQFRILLGQIQILGNKLISSPGLVLLVLIKTQDLIHLVICVDLRNKQRF